MRAGACGWTTRTCWSTSGNARHNNALNVVDLLQDCPDFPVFHPGDPTKAICSTLIAESFQSIRYPILPEKITIDGKAMGIAPFVQGEINHIRKHGLYTPRDFDVSPYFAILKPGLDDGFDYHDLIWAPPSWRKVQESADRPLASR